MSTNFRGVRKTCENDCLSVRPPAWNNSASTEQIFIKFDIWEFIEILSKKKYILLNSTRNNGCFSLEFLIDIILPAAL